ncbi:DUF1641 domain-containing protein [Dyella jejuensis]|uniref:DUF1641 domain-containing protein n=1 Tax=Dyella jejuensis TaxID=1432009 RepID=A0ABW8JCX6_9GAMM
MAEPISYQTIPPRIEPTARQELDRLLETLHRTGVLRLANDFAAGRQDIAGILVHGLNLEGSRNAMQNIAALAMVLAQVPPPEFYKAASTLKDMLLAAAAEPDPDQKAPGVRGLYRLLNDDDTWRAFSPLLRAWSALGAGLRKPAPEKPISAFTGKPSNA